MLLDFVCGLHVFQERKLSENVRLGRVLLTSIEMLCGDWVMGRFQKVSKESKLR